ncbi:MAG: efflux RND transporter permease subunit [Deltaproteobacteria bacterium]|nr:efflux RND transporter permease subunit [Deltaproteobacteria bacterium]
MLDHVIRLALRQRVLVLALAVIAMGAGLWTATRLPVDVFPDLNRPTVTIMTEAGGLSPEEVEILVTQPIETAMNGAPGVVRVRSSSAIGLSIVWVELDWGTDQLENRQRVSERLTTLAEVLPPGITPMMGPITSIMGEIMLIGVTSKQVAPEDLRAWTDFTATRALQAIPGIAQVYALGGGRKVVRVALDPDRLARHALAIDEVVGAVEGAQGNTTGGLVDRQGDELLVRNIARTSDLDRLRDTVVAHRGRAILLREVASVRFEAGVRRGEGGVDGEPAVILLVQKQPAASTLDLTRAIDGELERLAGRAPAGTTLRPLFRQSEFIEASVDNVTEALRDGVVLVVLVLVMFLLNVRTTFITVTAIPLSLAVTAIVFAWLDLSVNTMTLGGIAVAIGELVDDAIVDVENVFRRLRENRARPVPRPSLFVVWQASREVRGSIVFATMLVVLVFVPLFALGGIEGRLFAPLGIAYIVSILASLVVSVTVTPALASLLLPNAPATAHTRDGLLVRLLKRAQARVVDVSLRHPWLVLAGAWLIVCGGVGLVMTRGSELLPAFNEGTATINLLGRPGIALPDSDRLARAAEHLVRQSPEVRSVGRRTGRTEQDEHAEGVHYSELDVDFHPADAPGQRPRADVLAEIRARLSRLPGVVVNIGQPISHRLDHLLSGVRAEVAIKVFGPDLAALREVASRIEGAARAIPGLVDVQAERLVLVPQLRVTVRPEAGLRFGIQPGALAAELETVLGGHALGSVIEDDRRHDLFFRLDEHARTDLDALAALRVDTPAGARVPLSLLAELTLDRGPNQILHDNAERRVAVLANVDGRDSNEVMADLERLVAGLELPREARVVIEGQLQGRAEAERLIAVLALLSLAGMVIVLWVHFRSMRLVAQVLVNIPLALVGSAAALVIADLPLSVATMVGFITLCGIASRNSILLIDHYLLMVRDEARPWHRDTIAAGSRDRLVPVLMTALTAALGLVPLVLHGDAPGKEVLHPVAVVILGGLVSSTLLDLVVTPAAFWLFGKDVALRPRIAQDDGLDMGPRYEGEPT